MSVLSERRFGDTVIEEDDYGVKHYHAPLTGKARDLIAVILNGKTKRPRLSDAIVQYKTADGDLWTAATHKGERGGQSEDRIILDLKRERATVADGHGWCGSYAAALFAPKMLNDDLVEGVREASEAMAGEKKILTNTSGKKTSGVCFASVQTQRTNNNRKELHVAMAGDVKVIVFDNRNRLVFETMDESKPMSLLRQGLIKPEEVPYHPERNVVMNSISGTRASATILLAIPVGPGFRFFMHSDGLSFSPQEILSLTSPPGQGRMPAREAIVALDERHQKRLVDEAQGRVNHKSFDRSKEKAYEDGFIAPPAHDNRAIVIGDIA